MVVVTVTYSEEMRRGGGWRGGSSVCTGLRLPMWCPTSAYLGPRYKLGTVAIRKHLSTQAQDSPPTLQSVPSPQQQPSCLTPTLPLTAGSWEMTISEFSRSNFPETTSLMASERPSKPSANSLTLLILSSSTKSLSYIPPNLQRMPLHWTWMTWS